MDSIAPAFQGGAIEVSERRAFGKKKREETTALRGVEAIEPELHTLSTGFLPSEKIHMFLFPPVGFKGNL